MKRRKVMKLFLAAVLAGSAILSGCGSSGSGSSGSGASSGTTSSVQSNSGGSGESVRSVSEVTADSSTPISDTITIARAGSVQSLDPVEVAYTNDIQIINMVCEELVTTNDEGTEIEGDLAQSWDISDDGLTYTFHLIPDLKFSDGNDVTAADWEFSFDRAMTTEDSPWTFAVSNIDSVEVPDDDTVVIHLKEKAANTLSGLSCFNVALQEKSQYDATNGYTEGNAWPIGTNSYAITENVADDHITLTRNQYFHGDAPKTETLIIKTVSDDNSRVMMLQSDDVDIVTDLPYSSMKEINNMDGFTAVGLPSTSNKYIILNETSNEALANKDVRKALLYATDKQTIVDMVLNGYGEPAVSFMSENGLYYDDSIEDVGYDVDKAKELLSDAGYADGFDLEILIPSGNDAYTQIATILKDEWAQIGVNLTITSMDQAALYDDEYAMKHEALIGSWSDDIADPSQLADYWFDYDSSQAFFTGYKNEEASNIFEESQVETDDSAREDLYHQLQEIFYDDVVAINLYHQEITVAMSDSIQGYVETPLYTFRFDNLIKTED